MEPLLIEAELKIRSSRTNKKYQQAKVKKMKKETIRKEIQSESDGLGLRQRLTIIDNPARASTLCLASPERAELNNVKNS